MSAHNEIWYLLNSGAGAPGFNMAMDEALLEFVSQSDRPILRFYDWSHAAASFGYFQRYADVQLMTVLRPLVRRPTGGGLVPHGSDVTYSFIVPRQHQWYGFTAKESYRRMHEWIQASMEKLSVVTALADDCHSSAGQCFIGHDQCDVMWHNQKIAGAAQRRTRLGLLIQGSIQPPIELNTDLLREAMCDVATQRGVQWVTLPSPITVEARGRVLERDKYSQTAYTQKR
jgi:lipoyl(octanoyl) transferase